MNIGENGHSIVKRMSLNGGKHNGILVWLEKERWWYVDGKRMG